MMSICHHRRATRTIAVLGALLLALTALPAGAPARAAAPPAYKLLTEVTAPATTNSNRDVLSPRIAFDSTRQRYLMIFATDGINGSNPNNEYQIYGQLLRSNMSFAATGNPGSSSADPTPFPISATASRDQPGAGSRDPTDNIFRPSLAYSSVGRSYLVAWAGAKTRGTGDDEHEIFGRMVDEDGQTQGAEFQISDQGPAGDLTYDATTVAVVANPGAGGEFLVVWRGDTADSVATNHEYEIYGRRISPAGAPLGAPFRISTYGPPADPSYDAGGPALAANTQRGEYMVIYPGSSLVGEQELYAQRVGGDGSLLGDELRLSDMGPDGDGNYDAYQGAITYSADVDEYLAVFPGVDLVLGETEIYGQRIDADGAELGVNDFRVSDMGTYGNLNYDAFVPDVAYNSFSREYLVIWQGDDTFDGDREIFAQRLGLNGAAVGIDDQRLSFHGLGPLGDYNTDNYRSGSPSVAYGAGTDLFTVIWNSDDGVDRDTGASIVSDPDPTFGLREDEYEAFGLQIGVLPTVSSLDTVPASSDGRLDEIEGVDAEVNGLSISFSKPMADQAGNSEPSDVTNPDNYRLLEAGANKQVDTVSCGALVGDDEEIALSGVSYSAATRTATPSLGAALAPGFYRLIVCANLRDSRGNPLDGDGDGAPGGLFTRRFSTLSAGAQPWLVLLYLAGDDVDPEPMAGAEIPLSLTEPIQRLLGRLAGMPYNSSARIVVLYDGNRNGDSRIYVREPAGLSDVTDAVAGSPIWPGFPPDRELDTGSISTLQSFIRWARTTYPGTAHSMLAVVDHGGGWAPDLNDVAQPRGRLVVQAGGWRGMSLDLGTEGGTSFSTRDTSQALRELGAQGEFDVIFFDACLMGMIESAYEIQPYTDYFIGGQNLLWAALPYDRYLAAQNLGPTTTPRQLSERIVTLYNAGAPGGQPFSIAAVESAGLVDVVGLVNGMGQLLHRLLGDPETATETEQVLRAAYTAAQKFDYDASFAIDPTDGYVDLADFAAQLRTAQISRDGKDAAVDVRGIAETLYNRITGEGGLHQAVIKLRVLSGAVRLPGRAAVTWDLDGAHGLSIYLPLGEQDKRRTGEIDATTREPVEEAQLDYYVDPDQLAFSRDAGPWAEMLAVLDRTTRKRDDRRPYTSPFVLAETRVFLPVLRR